MHDTYSGNLFKEILRTAYASVKLHDFRNKIADNGQTRQPLQQTKFLQNYEFSVIFPLKWIVKCLDLH